MATQRIPPEDIGARAKLLQDELRVYREESESWRRLSDAERVEYLVRVIESIRSTANKAVKPDMSSEFALGVIAERIFNAMSVVAAYERAQKLEKDLKQLTPTTVDSR